MSKKHNQAPQVLPSESNVFRPVWSYVPLVDESGKPTGYCRIYCRVRFIPVPIITAEVQACDAEKLCQELNS